MTTPRPLALVAAAAWATRCGQSVPGAAALGGPFAGAFERHLNRLWQVGTKQTLTEYLA